MIIEVVKGSGVGETELAAFDNALFSAGIANYNLIFLSSVIPPNTKIIDLEKRKIREEEYGHKLYVVFAKAYATDAGVEAWSGLGWVKHSDNNGKGLFVEHSGNSEKEVIHKIKKTLESMAEYRPEERGIISYKTCGIKCKERPVCSLVAAVFKSEGWN